MSKEHQFIDKVVPTEVYTATMEFRSVGMSPNLLPNIKFSHYFKEAPQADEIPYAFRVVLDLAEAMQIAQLDGSKQDLEMQNDNPDQAVLVLDAQADKNDGGKTEH